MRSRARLRTKIILLASSLLLTLLVCEVLVRIFYPVIHLHRSFVPGIFEADPETGHVLRANYKGEHYDYYGEIAICTSTLGLRGPEPEVREDQLRVLCVGDSNTFGLGVGEQETFSHRLQEHLREAGADAAVWNAGVPAYGTRQERILLGRLAPVLRPDVVVLGWLENDVAGSLVDWVPPVTVIDGYLVESVEGIVRSRNVRLSEDFWQASRLAEFISLEVRLWRHERKFERRAERYRKFVQAEENIVANLAQVREMARAAEEIGAGFVVVVNATRGEVVSGEKHAAVVRIEEMLSAAGIPYVSLAEEFRADQVKIAALSYGDGKKAEAAWDSWCSVKTNRPSKRFSRPRSSSRRVWSFCLSQRGSPIRNSLKPLGANAM